MDPTPEQPRERTFLPVSKDVAAKVLAEIRENPEAVFREEGIELSTRNGMLGFKFGFLAQKYQDEKADFHQGAVFGYRILRKQAESKGEKLKNMSREEVDAALVSTIDLMTKAESRGLSLFDFERERFKALETVDPEYYSAIEEMSQYRAPKRVFNFAAAEIYSVIARGQEAEQLEQQLNH